MKARDELTTSVLRMAKAAVMKFEVSGKQKVEATDEDILKILKKELKQRKEAAEAFRKGEREDLAVLEEAEAKILEPYLPAQLSEEEIEAVLKTVIAETGAQGKQELGKVIGAAMGRLGGKAEGGIVSAIASRLLS